MARRRRPEPRTGQIHDLTHDGRGVTEHDGKRVFVQGALPGESVRYQVVKQRRQYDEALSLEVGSPAPARVQPQCAVYGVCGGCSLQHLAPPAQLEHKQNVLVENLRRIGQLEDLPLAEPLTGPVWHYRRRARLGVKYVLAKERVLVGFRERLKPYIADMQACEILAEPVAQLPEQLAELIGGLSIRARLPQVEVAVGDNVTALVFRVLDAPSAADLDQFAAFQRDTGFRVCLQSGGPETIEALATTRTDLVDTAGQAEYRLDSVGITLGFEPTDFVQINRDINAALIDAALDGLALKDTDYVLDLFCGLGNFTLPIATRAQRVIGVEGVAALTERGRQNATRNGIANADFAAMDLTTVTGAESWLSPRPNKVLLDPARAGASEMMPVLGNLKPERVVYVSCHPGTLARDLGMLVNDFGFTLTRVGVADMFPHTAHVESIAVLEGPP